MSIGISSSFCNVLTGAPNIIVNVNLCEDPQKMSCVTPFSHISVSGTASFTDFHHFTAVSGSDRLPTTFCWSFLELLLFSVWTLNPCMIHGDDCYCQHGPTKHRPLVLRRFHNKQTLRAEASRQTGAAFMRQTNESEFRGSYMTLTDMSAITLLSVRLNTTKTLEWM